MSRALTASILFQSYIALGLEPGTSWEDVQRRHKDLIMAWHPDRFVDDKQKDKAEDELKKINASRDVLRRHFQKEHSTSSSCPCRAQSEIPPATQSNESHSGSRTQAPPQQAQYRPSAQPASLFKSQIAATIGLMLVSFCTLAIYHKLATSSASRGSINQYPSSGRDSAPTAPASDQALPPGQPSADTPFADQAIPAAPIESTGENINESPVPLRKVKTRRVPGTFYSGFSALQEEREQQKIEARRQELKELLTRTSQALAAASNQAAELQKKIPAIDKEIEHHQSVLTEITQVNSDLETPSAGKQASDPMQLYLSNPDYKRHADAVRDLTSQKQSLQTLILGLKEQVRGGQEACRRIKDELAGLETQ